MSVQVKITHQYGQRRIFPVNGQAKIFAEIAGQKTLSEKHIELIKELGFDIEVIPEVL